MGFYQNIWGEKRKKDKEKEAKNKPILNIQF